MSLLLASGNEFHSPDLSELFEWPAFNFAKDWELFGLSLALNRTAVLMLLSAVIISVVLILAFRRPSVVPGKFQAAVESIFDFIRESIVIEVIGPAGLKFVPLLSSLFLFIWLNNLYEILPFVNFPTTSRMAIPAFLAFLIWAVFVFVGIKEQGIAYFKNVAVPPGVPAAILVLVIPIEIVSTFVVRPLTLAVRLFANMMAGHIILAIIFIAANAFLIGFDPLEIPSVPGLPVGVVALIFGPGLVAFELLVGVLQAYIFTILAAVYIGGSLHPEH